MSCCKRSTAAQRHSCDIELLLHRSSSSGKHSGMEQGREERIKAAVGARVLGLDARTLRNLVDEAARHVQLAQRQLVVVPVVQHVQQVRVERVHIVHLGEVLQDLAQLLVPAGGRELDLRGRRTALSLPRLRRLVTGCSQPDTPAQTPRLEAGHVHLLSAAQAALLRCRWCGSKSRCLVKQRQHCPAAQSSTPGRPPQATRKQHLSATHQQEDTQPPTPKQLHERTHSQPQPR